MCNKKRNRLELILVLAIFFVIAGVISPRAIQADSGAKFSVSINNNSQQIDPQLPYFNLNMQPNSETNLSLNIYNRSKKAAKFTVWANKAITNNNMIIDYSARKITKSPNLPSTLNIYKMISPKVQNIQVPANGTKKIAFKLKMPDQQFNGRLLGGIYVRKQIEKSVKSGFTNRFNFATAVVIRQNNRQVKPELNLNKVRINNLNWTRTVEASTQNVSKTYLSHVKTAAKIYPAKNPKKIVIRQKLDNRSIAPNSSFNYQLPLKNQKLKLGKYILDLKFISKNPDQIWHWKRSLLTPVLIGDGNYNWNYDIDQLPDKDQFLTRTSGDKIRFQVNDTRDTKPKFRITAAYKPNQNQTYSMWFKHSASEDVSKATQLNSNEQTIMDGNQMHAQNGVYTSDFGNDAGLVIRANNRATAGKYSGVVDWTVVNGM